MRIVMILGVLAIAATAAADHSADILAAREVEYAQIARHIKELSPAHKGYARLEKEVLDPQALILASDHDPADVVLRRTQSLLKKLGAMEGAPGFKAESVKLQELAEQAAALAVEDAAKRKELFLQVCDLRRRIAFKNPLLDFDSIVMLTKHRPGRGDRHMVDQYYGFNAKPGGRLLKLSNLFGEEPAVTDLLAQSAVSAGRLKGRKLEGGAFNTLDLDYDGKTLLFAWSECGTPPADASWKGQPWTEALARRKRYFWHPSTVTHIFRVGVDGSGLVQLTDGKWHDFDPCFLPSGRIVFVSERRGGYLRCSGNRPNPTYTLYGMMRDGSDIIPLSYHETNEWNPSVNHDGLIVYSRWDYVDRDSDVAHHLWLCNPDGRDPRSRHGNYPVKREARPWMELSIRAIPGSHRYIAVAAAHHGYNYGSLVLIDQRVPDDNAMSQVKRVTPEVHFPESESAPGVAHGKGTHRPRGEVYGTPWPMSEDFYLCVYDPAQKRYALTLLDRFGNRILLYRDPEAACLDPIPLRERKRPHVIPVQTQQAKADKPDGDVRKSTVAVMNVYESDFEWPSNTVIKALRIIQVFPKATYHASRPMIGVGAQSLARGVVGTVPVESDGSAYFEMPAGMPFYFQALDEKGLAVQSMRSATYLHEGEQMSCTGCHESKDRPALTARDKVPLALRKPPGKLTSGPDGAYPISFPRLVQPVLDRSCVPCHSKEEKAPGLAGDRFGKYGWSEAYQTLGKFAWAMRGGNGAIARNGGSRSKPGKLGARASTLYQMLVKGHHDVKLADEDMARIVTWLDCNSNFYGAYRETERQARGELVEPALR